MQKTPIEENEWEHIKCFESKEEMTRFFKPIATTKYSNKKRCTICELDNEHYMRLMYKHCKNEKCFVRYKVVSCEKTNYEAYQKGKHDHEIVEDSYGIDDEMKSVILEALQRGFPTPKKIHVYIMSNKETYKEATLPSLPQVQSFIYREKNKAGNNNLIEGVEEFVKLHKFKSDIAADQPFVFGINYNNDKPIIGSGSDDDHLHIGMTSLNLLNLLRVANTVFHIDATYKVVMNNFPLVVFGITDLSRQFFPLAFFLTSHETRQDFFSFYSSFCNLCNELRLPFCPTYIMQDACPASANAAMDIFGSQNMNILMCWFHVTLNVRKNENLIPEQSRKEVWIDINQLHRSRTYSEYQQNFVNIMYKWSTIPGMSDFKLYFETEWINTIFNKWQLFYTPPGYSPTNSPIESFNRQIKQSFTDYQRLTVKAFLDILGDKLIKYYSNEKKSFLWHSSPDANTIKLAQSLDKSKIAVYDNQDLYVTGSKTTHSVKLNPFPFCSCSYFLDKAICYHFLAACMFLKVPCPGYSQIQTFHIKKKKGRPAKAKPALVTQT